MAAVTCSGPTLEDVSRQCLIDVVALLAEVDPPPSATDLEEMQTESEGWGPQWRPERAEEIAQQAEYEAREQQKLLKRKREGADLSQWLAETAEMEKESKERKGTLANDELEPKKGKRMGPGLRVFDEPIDASHRL